MGIPVIGCNCAVCMSTDPRNRRRRTALYLETDSRHVIIDTSPDFREQALENNIQRVDAVLFTHSHADHVFGFDDIRRFNTIQKEVIPAYGAKETVADLRRIFDYIGIEKEQGMYRPQIEFREIAGPFDLGDIHVEPLHVVHGLKPTLGFLFETDGRKLAYVPDCHMMDDDIMEKLKGVDVMILDALRHRPHKTHLTVENSVKMLDRIAAGRSYLIHMCHDLDHEETEKNLPDPIHVSYDGLTIEI